jgi:DnaK suppressor protein
METYDNHMAPRFAELLEQRAVALQRLLKRDLDAAGAEGSHEVTDFKDAAGEESQALVDEAQAAGAALELAQVAAARRRLRDHTYGLCLECAAAIDLRRLVALPATPLCTACQALHEQTARAATAPH